MWTKMWTRAVATGCVAVAALTVSGCNERLRSDRSPAYLIVEDLSAGAGGDDGNELNSDVLTGGGVFEDVGLVTFRLALKNIGQPGSAVAPTTNNIITVTRHRVSFRRTDGRNTPGVDVPWPFEGAGTISVSDTADLSFVLVRAQAKLEPPLRQLANASFSGVGGAGLISTIADVTFYGYDQVGNEITASGSISVNFADWSDEDE